MARVVRALVLTGLVLSCVAGCGGAGGEPSGVGFLDGGGRDGGALADARPAEVEDAPAPDGGGPSPRCDREGQRCDDGDPCTLDDRCAGGVCGGDRLPCDDRDPCTDDGCAPGSGCFHEPGTGAACDDGNGCTSSASHP